MGGEKRGSSLVLQKDTSRFSLSFPNGARLNAAWWPWPSPGEKLTAIRRSRPVRVAGAGSTLEAPAERGCDSPQLEMNQTCALRPAVWTTWSPSVRPGLAEYLQPRPHVRFEPGELDEFLPPGTLQRLDLDAPLYP